MAVTQILELEEEQEEEEEQEMKKRCEYVVYKTLQFTRRGT